MLVLVDTLLRILGVDPSSVAIGGLPPGGAFFASGRRARLAIEMFVGPAGNFVMGSETKEDYDGLFHRVSRRPANQTGGPMPSSWGRH